MLLEMGAKAEISEPHRSCSNPSQTGRVWMHTGYQCSCPAGKSRGTEEQQGGTSRVTAGCLKPPKNPSLGCSELCRSG